MLRKIARRLLPRYSTLGVLLEAARESFGDLRQMVRFRQEFQALQQQAQATRPRFRLDRADWLPCFKDRTSYTTFDAHYTYHPAWAARILAQTRPECHIDISSILAFPTMLSAFMPVRFFDYRPARLHLSNLSCEQADMLALPFADGECSSVSCLHTIEHVGLGRYGDPLDYDGDLKAMKELVRVMRPGGDLLIVTPVGQNRIVFNGHRSYSYDQVLEGFQGCQLVQFSLVTDDRRFLEEADPALVAQQAYGCGCFWFRKQ